MLARATAFALLVTLIATHFLSPLPGSALASSYFFRFGRICIAVYDLRADHEYTHRFDLAEQIAPVLQEMRINKYVRVNSGKNCVQPHEQGFPQQLQFDLYIKRQEKNIDGRKFYIAIIDGSAPSVGGSLSAYELQPIVLAEQSEISDQEIRAHLIAFTERNLIRLIK